MTYCGSLGAVDAVGQVHGRPAGRDPFLDYGVKSARLILSRITKLPPDQRKKALRVTLGLIDPGLWDEVERKATAFAAQGRGPAEALERALAASLANGITERVVGLGKRRVEGMGFPLGDTDPTAGCKVMRVHKTYYGLVISYRTCSDKKVDISKTTTAQVFTAAKGPIRAQLPAEVVARMDSKDSRGVTGGDGVKANQPWALWKIDPPQSEGKYYLSAAFPADTKYDTWDQAQAIAFTLVRAPDDRPWWRTALAYAAIGLGPMGWNLFLVPGVAKESINVAKDVANTVEKVACAAVSTPVSTIAAAGGAAAMGAPPQTGAIGVAVAQNLCGGATEPPPPPPPPPFPWVPVLLVGAGGLLIVWGLT